jgi:hypothetical protein
MRIVVALCMLLLVAVAWSAPVHATQTVTTSGEAFSQHWYEIHFDTYRPGDVAVRATWTPDPRRIYVLQVKRLLDPNDVFSYDRFCEVHTGKVGAPPNGDWTCTLAAGAPGHYYAAFGLSGGKVFVTLLTTAETDP